MSMIKELLVAESAVTDNINVTTAISELAAIQESSDILDDKIVYTAEAVPVFAVQQNGKKTYVIECDNLFKLMDSQGCDEVEALGGIKSVLAGDDPEIKFDSMALLVKDENFQKIEETCKSDKSKIGIRTEQIMNYTKLLNNVMAEGVQILVDR